MAVTHNTVALEHPHSNHLEQYNNYHSSMLHHWQSMMMMSSICSSQAAFQLQNSFELLIISVSNKNILIMALFWTNIILKPHKLTSTANAFCIWTTIISYMAWDIAWTAGILRISKVDITESSATSVSTTPCDANVCTCSWIYIMHFMNIMNLSPWA